MRRTDQEMRSTHVRLGGGGVAAVGASAALAAAVPGLGWPSGVSGLLDSAALVGATAGSVAMAAALTHHSWYFDPNRSFRRELGGTVGWLDGHDLANTAGRHAVREYAARLFTRPELHSAPMHESGWEVGRLVSGPSHLRRRRVYCPWTRGTAIVGPPGSGKSQFLIGLVLAAPGAAVVTSTKPELARATMAIRQATRGPVEVFNPEDIGGLASTFAWDPVAGCHHNALAARRAAAMVRGSGSAAGVDNAGFWSAKAVEILQGLLMAAALGGYGMDAVMAWASEPAPADGVTPRPVEILERHSAPAGPAPATWAHALRANLAGDAAVTRAGYMANVLAALAFMGSPGVAAACHPRPGTGLDIPRFLAEHGTLYLIGGGQDSRIAPLLTCLTEELFTGAKAVAAARPNGVLERTCAFLLDEVANLTPVPLDEWAADSRGWGITVVPVFQTASQLAETWGQAGGEVIRHALPVRVTLPNVTDTRDLDHLSYLGGKRRVRTETHNAGGLEPGGRGSRGVSVSRPREHVVDGDVISRMPENHAYVTGLARHPAVVKFTPGRDLVTRRRIELGLPA